MDKPDIGGANKLGELLRAQIERYKGGPQRIPQTDVAVAMGIDPGHFSKIVNDKLPKAAGRLEPDAVRIMMRRFHFTDDEARAIIIKFSLRMPPDLLNVENFTPRPLDLTGTVEFPIRSLRTPTEGGPVVLTQVFLGTHRAEDVFTIEAGGSLLACEAVKRELKSGYALFFDAAQTPAEGQPVIYRLEGQDRYMVTLYETTLTPRWVTSYDGKDGEFIEPGKPPLELLGVYWRFIPPEGWLGEKTVNPS